jgi:membrane protein
MLEKELIERMSGQEQAFERILAFSRRLLENTQGGIMAGVGVVVMLWAALKAVGQIESALNAIWDVPAPRRWVRKFTDYLALMLIAPVLLISASSATIFIRTQIDTVAGYLRVSGLVAPLVEAVFKFGPVLIIWTLFTLIYKAMPNKRVPLSTAIVGGVFGGSLFLIVQGVYIAFQIGVANSNAIYGSFAALPLFLVWVQTSWTIVLFGAEFGYAFEHAPSYSCPTGHPAFGPGEKKLLALKITRRLVRRFSEGRPALGLSDLSRELKLSERFLEPVLADLQQGGIVSEAGAGGRRAFQPAFDIHRLAIGAVLAAMDRSFPSGRRRPDEDEETRSLVEVLQDFHRAAAAAPANRLVKDL